MKGQDKTDRHRSVWAIKIFKTATMILFVALVAASFIYVANSLFDVPHINVAPVAKRLGAVDNIRRQGDLVTWDAVRHASYYIVEVNGRQFVAEACRWSCPDDPNTIIRIKAVDSSGRRGDSAWSYFNASSTN